VLTGTRHGRRLRDVLTRKAKAGKRQDWIIMTARTAEEGFESPSRAGWLTEQARRLAPNIFDSYQPELHYMRGPGPKWREKHVTRPAQHAPQLGEFGLPGLRRGI
jgi:hypothetical protein